MLPTAFLLEKRLGLTEAESGCYFPPILRICNSQFCGERGQERKAFRVNRLSNLVTLDNNFIRTELVS